MLIGSFDGAKPSGDTGSYLNALESGIELRSLLADPRTPGYPLVLWIAQQLAGDSAGGVSSLSLLPHVQGFLYFAALLAAYAMLVTTGVPALISFLVIAPMADASILAYVDVVRSEVPAAAFAILAACGLLSTAVFGPSRLSLATAAIAAFGACMIRPAYLFLYPLAVVGIILIAPIAGRAASWRSLAKEALRSGVVVGLPLLAYMTLRLLVVGHFGLVSFAGNNIIGFTANPYMLDEVTVQMVDGEENKRLAAEILAARTRRLAQPDTGGLSHYRFRVDTSTDRLYDAWYQSFNPAIHVAMDGARSYWDLAGSPYESQEWPTIDRALVRLSREVLVARLPLYIQWLREAGLQGLRDAYPTERGGRDLILALLAMLIFFVGYNAFRGNEWHLVHISRGVSVFVIVSIGCVLVLARDEVRLLYEFGISGVFGDHMSLQVLRRSLIPMSIAGLLIALAARVLASRILKGRLLGVAPGGIVLGIIAFSLLFYIAGLALVILVEPPLARYLQAVSMFLPGVVTLGCLLSYNAVRRSTK